ncbi:MAG: EF-hand domain-containing protein [Verrucomicrobiales bacterium]
MKINPYILSLGLIPLSPLVHAQSDGGKPQDGGKERASREAGARMLPDLRAFTATGEPLRVRELCDGKYTVLSSGCLTCPLFHQTYSEIEAAHADFSGKDVQFFYFYKALRHPELEGYLQAQNMSERLLQLAEAREKLGTKVSWIADTIDDSMRLGLNANSQSVYLISPEGEIVYSSGRIDREGLRSALTKAVGATENVTSIAELKLPVVTRPARLVNEESATGVVRPEGLTILAIEPGKPDETYLVKLRAEGDGALLKTGTGRLFLGFYPDPIHDVHWNNLGEPMRYKLTLPEGISATPAEGSASKGPGDSDTLPRQFWVDVTSTEPGGEIKLQLDYFGCTSTLCMALTHEYTIQLKAENRGARTYGMNRVDRRGGGNSNRPTGAPSGRSSSGGRQIGAMDTDKDGSVSFEEMRVMAAERRGESFDLERFRVRFKSMDKNKDGTLSAEELGSAPRGNRREGQ